MGSCMKKYMVKTLVAGLAVCAVSVAQASPIVGLYNTGAGITINGTTDTNYALTNSSGAAIYGNYGEAAVGSGWPISPWLADNSTSHWLTPTSNRAQSYDSSSAGTYKWTLQFNLTGYNATTASFEGKFSADNNAVAYLNGNNIGSAAGFSSWYNFSAGSSLFNAGVNNLEFVVTNLKGSGNPTGLRVEMTNSNVSAVPLPGAVWFFMSGMLGLLAVKRKSKSI